MDMNVLKKMMKDRQREQKMLEDYMRELNQLADEWKGLDVREDEYEDVEDYLDDGDDMGECVSSIREYAVIVYKQLTNTTHKECVGRFPNHYEAINTLERQGVYERYWTDQFGREWEVIFDYEYNREADADCGIADNCDYYTRAI